MLKINLLFLSCAIIITLLLSQCSIPETEDGIPPIAFLIYPVDGSVIGGNIVVTVQATDDREITQIWYTLNGTIMDRSENARADFQLDLSEYPQNREYVFQAGAIDNTGNNNVSDQVIVTIAQNNDFIPPTVVITNPLTDQEVVDSIMVIADAEDDNYISEVSFFVNGDSVSRDLSYPYEFMWSVSDFPLFTSQNIYARAYDGNRNRSNSENVTIMVVPGLDQVSPTARLLFPLAGQILYGTIEVQVDASDDRELDRVEFFIDGILVSSVDASVNGSPFSYTWDTSSLLVNSQHSLFFKAIDTAGNESNNAAVLFTIGVSP